VIKSPVVIVIVCAVQLWPRMLGAQGRSIFYIVGDSTTQSSEYEFRVPPLPGAKKITIIACSSPPTRAPD
jgi:hypothetical protein